MKMSDELREAAGLNMLDFCVANGIGLHSVEPLRKLLHRAADELDRLSERINNKSVYEQWLDEKQDRERD
jgi:hypothetical protein